MSQAQNSNNFNELGENVSLLPVEESEPVTKKKKSCHQINIPKSAFMNKDRTFHHIWVTFGRILNSCNNRQVEEGNNLLPIRNVLAHNSYKVYRLSGRMSLETYNKTIFQTNKIKIMKHFEQFRAEITVVSTWKPCGS